MAVRAITRGKQRIANDMEPSTCRGQGWVIDIQITLIGGSKGISLDGTLYLKDIPNLLISVYERFHTYNLIKRLFAFKHSHTVLSSIRHRKRFFSLWDGNF